MKASRNTRLLPLTLLLSVVFLSGANGCLQQPYSPGYSYSYNAPSQYGYPPYSKVRMASDTHLVASDTDLNAQCLERFPNTAVACAVPFERRTATTESECHRLCAENGPRCLAFQYESISVMCDLFDVIPRQRGARDDISYRKKRYVSKRNGIDGVDDFARDPLRLSSSLSVDCEPKTVSALGSTFVVVDADCSGSTLASSDGPVFLGSVEPFGKSQRAQFGSGASQVIPDMADCLDLSRARVQLIDGIELTQQAMVVVQLSSPDECLHVCRLNAFMDGSRLPRPCRSAVFDRSTGRCSISDSAISPNGELNYAPNQNSVYFEKTCIPESDLPMGCDDVFRRIPQVTLNPAAVGTGAVVTAQTQIECIRRCIGAYRHLGFNCRAASYYFETPDRNCYLSRFARDQRADIYTQDREKLVDYIEMPKCLKTDWQHDESPQSSEWSEWTECDQTMTKSRSRNCTRCSPKKETVECFSKPAFVQEFPKELEDVEKDPKPLAMSFDSAKRLHKPSLNVKPLSERSLFGEQDYDHQEEVSFFGPPLAENSNGATECDPRAKCCPQPIGVRSVVRGCSVGFRIEADGSRVVCMPDNC